MTFFRTIAIAAIAVLSFSTSLMSQDLKMIVEKPLKMVDNDMDARIYYPVKDQNDKLCALVKVVLLDKLESPLILEVGGLGVIKREERDNGEIWFYVPYQVKNLSFKCANYAPLSVISVQLKEATVYAMSIRPNAKRDAVVVTELMANYAKIVTNAEGATFSIGQTTDYEIVSESVSGSVFSRKLNFGKYYFKVEHPYYETYEGEFTMNSQISDIKVNLQPAYGYLTVKSNPSGAKVYVKDIYVGETPCVIDAKLPKGRIPVRIQLNNYSPTTDTVFISGNGGRQEVTFELQSQLSRVNCKCEDPEAEIWIDDELKGKGSWSGFVDNVAEHILESRKPGHKSQSISFSVKPGMISNQVIPAPVPMYGTMELVTNPELCEVIVDGVNMGSSPLMAKLLSGQHSVQLIKDGYTPITFNVEIEYDNTKKVTKTLFDETKCTAPEEMFTLGDNYFFGKSGVNRDPEKAAQWYSKASDMNFAPAQYALGFCYENGYGVDKDMEKAVEYYTRAADQNNPEAQFCMGYCYEKGVGTEKNLEQAFSWYKKAAEQGHMTAQNNLAFCYRYGRGVEQNKAEAFKWYKKSAQQGFPIAQTNLGVCYLEGIGTQVNRGEGIKWLRKAAEQGEKNAISKLNSL